MTNNFDESEFYSPCWEVLDHYALIEDKPAELKGNFYKLKDGIPCANWFPENVVFSISEDNGMILPDSIPNIHKLLLVSDRLKRLLSDLSGSDLEFLPVSIRDQEGQLVSSQYYIANILKKISCLDVNNSDYDVSNIDPKTVRRFRKVALLKNKIQDGVHIFRIGEDPKTFFFSGVLANRIIGQEFTGIEFIEISDIGKEFRED